MLQNLPERQFNDAQWTEKIMSQNDFKFH